MRTTSLLLLLGSLMAVPATQAADASDWLNRLAEADRQNSFQGTFVYERNGSFSTHEIWHRVESDGAVRERLLRTDGARQEVVRSMGAPSASAAALPTNWPMPSCGRCASSILHNWLPGTTCAWSANPVSPAARQWSSR